MPLCASGGLCGQHVFLFQPCPHLFCILTNDIPPQGPTRAASFDRAGELAAGVVGQVALVLGALLSPWCAAWAICCRFQPCPLCRVFIKRYPHAGSRSCGFVGQSC